MTGSVSIFGIFNDAVWLKKAKELGGVECGRITIGDAYGGTAGMAEHGMVMERIRELGENETIEDGPLKGQRQLPEWAEGLQPTILNQLRAIFQRTPQTLLRNTGIHFLLGLLNESELLLELFAHALQDTLLSSDFVVGGQRPLLHFISERLRSSVILFIEMFKAALRLTLLWRNGGRMLTHMAVPSREDAIALASSSQSDENEDEDGDVPIPTLPPLHRVKYERYTLDDFSALKSRITPSMPTSRSVLGELLWIIRPVIFVILKLRFGRSWKPWMVGLIVDLISRRLSQKHDLSSTEQDELARRKSLLYLYALRSPFYELLQQLLGPAFDKLYDASGRLPGIQTAWDFVSEILYVYRTRYFYMAGSASP